MITQDLGIATAYGYAKSKGYTGTEAEFAELMASYASVAQSAAASATAAAGSATSAASSANTASTAASTATTKASEASTSATNASGSASSAASSASAASGSATSAAASATTASGKASEATTAAATAVSAKDDAVSANTAAQSAKTAAQTAQTGAETAAASVQSSAAQIQTNADDISELKEDLNQKANQDGYYADLVSGGSTQLLSDMVSTDTTPYNYRTAGGSLEIGDRMKLKKIVGGSLVVNQLIRVFSSDQSVERNGITLTDNRNGSYTLNGTATENGTFNIGGIYDVSCPIDHVFLMIGFKKTSGNAYMGLAGLRIDMTGNGGVWKNTTQYPALGFRIDFFENDVFDNVTIKPQWFDLTAMFGTTIADYVYSLETATAGAGVAWLKAHFPKIFDAGYIPYNAGTLEHVSGLSAHNMTGFNQWDEEWENGYIDPSTGNNASSNDCIRSKNYNAVFPDTSYYVKVPSGSEVNCKLYFYDENKGFISWVTKLNEAFITPSNARYLRFYMSNQYGTTYNHDICINLHWDGERDGEYEPYEEHSYPLDSDVTLRGIPKLDANNNLYYDGDEYTPDGTVTRNIVDFEATVCTSVATASTGVKYVQVSLPRTAISEASANNFISDKYAFTITAPNEGGFFRIVVAQLYIFDNRFTDKETADSILASEKPHFVYAVGTPTTEEADQYTEIQNVSNWGTEEFVTTSLVPVGHETAYQPDLRAKIEVAPESPDGDGLYLMKRENGQNSYVAYLGELPSDPTTDGTYTLKCTVASGTATKTWEADE